MHGRCVGWQARAQADWLRLRAIFAVDDVARFLPSEARYFGAVENTLQRATALIVSNPRVVDLVRADEVVKGTQRKAFCGRTEG
jgi:hypothetical protein